MKISLGLPDPIKLHHVLCDKIKEIGTSKYNFEAQEVYNRVKYTNCGNYQTRSLFQSILFMSHIYTLIHHSKHQYQI